MALTRIRAQQISNIDYKQSVRVVTTTDVGLTGGAPDSVDGVSLAVNNRILVAGQSNQTQNGLYLVQTLGSGGATGTWVRTNDTNTTGEMQSGMIVTVTEGDQYKDTLWTLTTNDPIVLGSSNITFQQSTSYSFGNISANGTAILANTVGDAVSFVAGDNISITGNATAKTVTIGVTGIQSTQIVNGTSNVDIATANGNVAVSVDGTANVAVFDASGANITGALQASGNITGSYFFGNGSQLSGIITSVANINNGTSNVSIDAANANITMAVDGTANVVVVSSDLVDVTGNITASGNITGDYFFGNGSQLSGIITSVSNINNGTSNVSIDSANANVTVGVDGTANVVVVSSGLVDITGNLTASGNIVGGGVRSTTSASPPSTPAVGDVWYNTNNNILYRYTYDGASYFWEDITGGSLVANSTAIINGTSTATVTEADGNIAVTIGAVANTAVFAADQTTFAGNLLPAANINYSLGSTSQRWKDLWISNSTIYLGDSVLSAQGNVLTVDGSAVITGSNANTIDLSGNISGGNITTAGNITGAYIIGNGSQLTGLAASYGNANVAAYLPTYTGNVGAGNVIATGNVLGSYIIGNGSQLTGLPASYGNANVASYLPTYTGNIGAGNVTVAASGTASAGALIATNGLILSNTTVTANYTVPVGQNALSIGPMAVANNVSVTVSNGQRWVII